LFRVLVLMTIAVLPGSAGAATILPIAGEVRLSTGQGFHIIIAPIQVTTGAEVMVSPEGSASIAYADDCVVGAAPAAITIVQDEPQCRDFPEPMHFTPAVDSEDVVAPEKTSHSKRKRQPKPVESDDQCLWDHNLLIVGGLVLGAGVLAATLISSDGPTSP